MSSSPSSSSAALQEAFAADWQWEIRDNPEFAGQAGALDAPQLSALQSVTPAAYEARAAHSRAMAERIAAIVAAGGLSEAERTCAELVRSQHADLADAIAACPTYLAPLNSIGAGGVCFSALESFEWMPLESAADLRAVIARLRAAPAQNDEFVAAMRAGLASGHVASAPMMRRVDAILARHAAISQDDGDLEAHAFDELAPALKLADALQMPEERTALLAACLDLRRSFARVLAFIRAEYAPRLRPDAGFSSLPSGAAGYAACLRYHTTTALTADEIHALGVAEVARIEARYEHEVCAPLGFARDFPAFLAHAKASPQFFKADGEQLLEHYRAVCARISAALPRYFAEFPRSAMEVTAADKGPCAFYLAGTADGKRPGRFYVNTNNLSGKPTYEAMALALHEGVPGHHHQVSLALENDALPKVLRHVEDRRYEVCPCRRQLFSAYVEGWALYCEYLGEEMGLYDTPYDLFGRLSMDMMRAVRLVVDTGIHAHGWSIERALEYFMSKTGMGKTEAENEIYRYASWPGQAVAYKVGQLEILRLRARAEAALKPVDCFDLKAFHSLCLNSGALTLSLLGEMVDKFIAERLQ